MTRVTLLVDIWPRDAGDSWWVTDDKADELIAGNMAVAEQDSDLTITRGSDAGDDDEEE